MKIGSKHLPIEKYLPASHFQFEKNLKKLNFWKSFLFSFEFRLVYIAFALCFILSLVSIFFVMLYGFSFGKIKSEAWILAMLVSLLLSIFVVQPIKVTILLPKQAIFVNLTEIARPQFIRFRLSKRFFWIIHKTYEENENQGLLKVCDTLIFFYKKLPQLWALKVS